MAVYYFEGLPILAPFTIESKRTVLLSETGSQKIILRAGEGQRWDLTFRVLTDEPETLFVAMLENDTEVSQMTMPQLTSVDKKLSPVTGYPVTTSSVSAGQSVVSINTNSFASYDTDKVIPKGAFIKFANHSKIYTVTSEVSSGLAESVNIFPPLQSDLSSGTVVYLPNTATKPQLTYIRAIEAISGITYSDGVLVDTGTIIIREKV